MPRLIDADALLNNIRSAIYPSDMTTTIAVGICENHVKAMPTVDAAPVVHGRWEHHKGGFADHFECTACGKAIVLTGRWRYCPHCGARMDGGEMDD